MKYLSICSGIESVGVAWHPLGFECLGLSEIDPFRSAVLNYHYPEVKNYGDFTQIERSDLRATPDILVGGTPCATFSIAGLRKGMGEDRGNLALEFIRLAQRIKPKWVLWENVPGVLSSNEGKDLGTFLGALAELRYGFAYRVLDTQYIRTQRFPRAIPQRRRRIFVVGCLGDWKSSAKVLFDEEAMSTNPRPSREERSDNTIESEEMHREFYRKLDYKGTFTDESETCGTIPAGGRFSPPENSMLCIEDPIALQMSNANSNGFGIKDDGAMYALTASDRHAVMCFEPNTPDGHARVVKDDISPTLNAMTGGNRQPCVMAKNRIRRLTITEAERLQGFPDNYTQIPYRNKPKEEAPISKRYEAVGRAMSINVMEWLGTRINMVHNNEI